MGPWYNHERDGQAIMRFLKPTINADHDQITRMCGHWFRDELGLKIVEYHLGNIFTGRIDMLATDGVKVFLITINSARFDEALLRSLMGFRWLHENKEFLSRAYGPQEIDLLLPLEIVILSPTFPPEALSILRQALKLPVRLFRYMLFDSEGDPEIYIEELSDHVSEERSSSNFDRLRRELGIEKAGLTDEEIQEFQAAMRA